MVIFEYPIYILTNTGREGVPERKLVDSYWEGGKINGSLKSVSTSTYQYKQLLLNH